MDSAIKQLLFKMWVPVNWFWSWTPTAASDHARDVDGIYYFLIWTCTASFFIVVVPMFYFMWRYRRKSPDQKALTQKDHNLAAELAWTILPTIYLAICFVWGFKVFLAMYTIPLDAKILHVVGQKWQWSVDYPEEEISVGGKGVVIGVPLGQPIELRMASQDVIHSFFIPNFRVKQDVVPGRYATLWFQPDQVGEFPVFCAEYCGEEHSYMQAKIKVMPMAEYKDWVDKIKGADKGLPPKELGAKLYVKLGCNACHTVDGTPKIAPTFKGLYGHSTQLAGGSSVKVTDDYIRKSILGEKNDSERVAGYPPVMPTFKGRVSEKDIAGLIEYIKSLQ